MRLHYRNGHQRSFRFLERPRPARRASLPLAAASRRGCAVLITRSRAAHAGDWRRSADVASGHTRAIRPVGERIMRGSQHFKDLTDRVDSRDTATFRRRARRLLPERALGDWHVARGTQADPAPINDPAWPARLEELRRSIVPTGAVWNSGSGSRGRSGGDGVSRRSSPATGGDRRRKSPMSACGSAPPISSPASFTDPLPRTSRARAIETARRNDLLRQARTGCRGRIAGVLHS